MRRVKEALLAWLLKNKRQKKKQRWKAVRRKQARRGVAPEAFLAEEAEALRAVRRKRAVAWLLKKKKR
jgi:hypothetical protein